MKASEHLEAVRSAISAEPHDDATHTALEALEFLLEPIAEKENEAHRFDKAASFGPRYGKPTALEMGEAIHQDFEDWHRFHAEMTALFVSVGMEEPKKPASFGSVMLRTKELIERVKRAREVLVQMENGAPGARNHATHLLEILGR